MCVLVCCRVTVRVCWYIVELLYDYVTCGSVLKLWNTANGVRLHSHDVKYGSGSGQQVRALRSIHTYLLLPPANEVTGR